MNSKLASIALFNSFTAKGEFDKTKKKADLHGTIWAHAAPSPLPRSQRFSVRREETREERERNEASLTQTSQKFYLKMETEKHIESKL